MTEEKENEFGEWLSAIMRSRHMSTSELARRMEVEPSTVSKWRTGRNLPDSLNCRLMAGILRVSANEVLLRAGHLDPDALHDDPVRAEAHHLVNVLTPEQLQPLLAMMRSLVDPAGQEGQGA